MHGCPYFTIKSVKSGTETVAMFKISIKIYLPPLRNINVEFLNTIVMLIEPLLFAGVATKTPNITAVTGFSTTCRTFARNKPRYEMHCYVNGVKSVDCVHKLQGKTT